jgi:hypothetical protein
MRVAAHTSAGTTVVADYAIALCLANELRVIYTNPIEGEIPESPPGSRGVLGCCVHDGRCDD